MRNFIFLNSISAGPGRISLPPVILLKPVGEGRECTDVGDVGVCLGPPRKGPTVPPLSTVFSIKHPPDEVAAIAAVLINLYSNQTAY